MATKPTRQQERACDKLAEAMLLIAEAARLNGPGPFDLAEMRDVARRLVRASTAFDLDAIIARALEARGRALGLRSGTAELITLIEEGVEPLAAILLADDDFKELVARAEAELGEV